MTETEVRATLENVRDTYRNYNLAREECARFRDMILGAPAISDMPHSQSRTNSTENKLIRIATYDEQIEIYFKRFLAAKESAERMINILENSTEREVLIRRYIMIYSWEQIAEQMHYSFSHLRRLHNIAINNIVNKQK